MAYFCSFGGTLSIFEVIFKLELRAWLVLHISVLVFIYSFIYLFSSRSVTPQPNATAVLRLTDR